MRAKRDGILKVPAGQKLIEGVWLITAHEISRLTKFRERHFAELRETVRVKRAARFQALSFAK
jgi:hypothetical protein